MPDPAKPAPLRAAGQRDHRGGYNEADAPSPHDDGLPRPAHKDPPNNQCERGNAKTAEYLRGEGDGAEQRERVEGAGE